MRTRTIKMYAMNPDFMKCLSEDSSAPMPALVLVSKTFTLAEFREYNKNRKADAKAAASAIRFMGLE